MSKQKNKTEVRCDGCDCNYPVDSNGVHIVPKSQIYPTGKLICKKRIEELFCEASKRFGTTLKKLADN